MLISAVQQKITDLDHCDSEWFALGMNRGHSVIFEMAPKYCISDSFVEYEGYFISSIVCHRILKIVPLLYSRTLGFIYSMYNGLPLLIPNTQPILHPTLHTKVFLYDIHNWSLYLSSGVGQGFVQ